MTDKLKKKETYRLLGMEPSSNLSGVWKRDQTG